MNDLEKIELRRLAEKIASTRFDSPEAIKMVSQWIGAASPANILSLLDENKRIANRLCACKDCCGHGEVYSGREHYEGHNQPPEPIMDVCGTCGGDGVLGSVQDFEAIAEEREQLRAEVEALSFLLKRFVDGEHDDSENQSERHHYHGESQALLARLGGEFREYSLVPYEALLAQRKDSDRYRWLRQRVGVDHAFGDFNPWLPTGDSLLTDQEQQESEQAIDVALDEVVAKGAQLDCECHRCIREKSLGKYTKFGFTPLSSTKMILCPACGNKRCPMASDHDLACTDSNIPGQPGSVYQ